MLDQSFSFENFRILLDVENRKGNYLEDAHFFANTEIFNESRKLTDRIIELNKIIREEIIRLNNIDTKVPDDYVPLNGYQVEKDLVKEQREQIRESILRDLSEKTNNEEYKIEISKGFEKYGSQLYKIGNEPEHYFVLKQLQRNIYKTFKVRQSDRRKIISQLKLILDDGFPKVIVRTDIQSFYESIPHKTLISKIEENSLLSYPSKKIIKDILNQYWSIQIDDQKKSKEDERAGVPRGIGISAYLSELYLRELDKTISSDKNVTYYSRYVDDIVIIYTPDNRYERTNSYNYKKNIKNIIAQKTGLKINLTKTSVINLKPDKKDRKASKKYELTYLGYKFKISYIMNKSDDQSVNIQREKLKIYMSNNKLERYETKIRLAFSDYNSGLLKYSNNRNGIDRLLIQRIRFLTNNFRLLRRKSNALVGIFYSNEFLTENDDLLSLDRLLKREVSAISNTGNQIFISKLKKFSFLNGFQKKVFRQFNYKSFESGKMLNIWKNL